MYGNESLLLTGNHLGRRLTRRTHAHPDSSQDKVAEIANLIASHWETGLHHELALAMEALPGVPIREVSVTDSVAQERS